MGGLVVTRRAISVLGDGLMSNQLHLIALAVDGHNALIRELAELVRWNLGECVLRLCHRDNGYEPGMRLWRFCLARAIALFREEIDRVMALIGARSVAELGPEYLHFTDSGFRRSGALRADLKLLEGARAAEA